MSFLVQRVAGRALTLNEVRGGVLRIGRGTQQQLRSDNPAVALEHAVIEEDQAGYSITDRGSITGTYVNSKAVETQRLAKGDVIEIGDLRIEVQGADAGKPLFLRVASTAARPQGRGFSLEQEDASAPAGPAGGTVKAQRFDFAAAYKLQRPYLTRWSITALLLILALAVLGEVLTPEKQKAFMPGGVSSAHARARDASGQPIGEKCNACHSAWNGVPSARCSECHGKASHAENVAAEPPCGDCHMEHRGTGKLAAIADSRCVSCHSSVGTHMKKPDPRVLATFPSINSFGDKHPEFTWPADNDTLRLNHRLHLAKGGIFNASGQREQLKCASCHKLVETRGKSDPAPITFEQDCHRCHRLTFDPRFPDTEVPHGAEPGLVYGFILQTYGGNSDIAGKSPEELRRILTRAPVVEPGSQAFINAEQVIKTKCSLCHDVQRSGGKLGATKPVIPTRWMEHANFSHGPHRNLDCESCHAASGSTRTSDVLMPARKECTDCHGSRPLLGTARSASNCILCHDYHDRKQITTRVTALRPSVGGAVAQAAVLGGPGPMLTTILLLAIFVLLLVVLIPIGYALYQRMKPAPVEPAAPVRVQAPAPPPFTAAPAPAPAPAAKAAPAPPAPAAAAPAPAPAAAAPQPAEPYGAATEMVKLDDIKKPAADAPQATEMVQWYGMLNCTAGPLEGQRFIIEPDGLYIGRDGSMSQIVINDSRVSKRHVRIVPRNGKVWAIDQGSTNGTFMGKAGGERITEVQLKRGDVLVLADNAATFMYQI